MSAQRFQAVVERIRKQVKVEGKKSKWVDTDKFVFKLFDGASITLPSKQAQDLAFHLNTVVEQVLAPWRSETRKRATDLISPHMTLSQAKLMEEQLRIIATIDALRYQAMPSNERASVVRVCSSDGVVVIGTDRAMNQICSSANEQLAEIMAPYQVETNAALRDAMSNVP